MPSRGCASAAASRCSSLFLLQLLLVPPLLIVPNLTTLVALGLYDTLPGVMAPYFASAFGVFLMRQTFRAIPRDYEEAALLDGARASQIDLPRAAAAGAARPGRLRHRLGHRALERVPVAADGDVLAAQPGADGRARLVRLGRRGGRQWGVIAAGTLLVAAPLLLVFVLFQRRFVSVFVFSGIK